MDDPFLWLSISTTMVGVSLVIFLAVLLPTIQEVNRTVRGAERLLDTLNRELPATLDALRSTTQELNQLTEDLGDGVESAKQIVKQVDRGLDTTQKQLTQARITSQGAIAGAKAAWAAFFQSKQNTPSRSPSTPTKVSHSRQSTNSTSIPMDNHLPTPSLTPEDSSSSKQSSASEHPSVKNASPTSTRNLE